MSGSVSGAVIALLSTPFELVKVRMQLDRLIGEDSQSSGHTAARPAQMSSHSTHFQPSSESPSPSTLNGKANAPKSTSPHPARLMQHVPVSSSFHAVREIYRSQGPFPGIYYCGTLQLARDVCGTALYFGNYETMKRTLITYANLPAVVAQALRYGRVSFFEPRILACVSAFSLCICAISSAVA